MPYYTYHCKMCQHINEVHYKLTEVRPDIIECQQCHEEAEYKISAPMVLRASYLDGQRSKQWKDLKEASKLNRAAASEGDLSKKKEINQEVRKIGFNFNKDPE